MLRSKITKLFCIFLLAWLPLWAMASEVSLKEKIGQMVMIGFKGFDLKPDDLIVQAIQSQQIGGVVLFDYDVATKTPERNIQNPEQLKKLTQQLQAYTKQAAVAHQSNVTPLLISLDYEGGKISRLKEKYGFPATLSAAEIGKGSSSQAEKYADQMAETLQQEGINVDFSPVVDVNINPDNPIIGKLDRSFSNDPEKVVEDASIFSKAYQQHKILCAYKHFPGHGSSKGDTHKGFVDVTQTWKKKELVPYEKLLKQINSCPIVMTAHVVNRQLDDEGYPASLSYTMTTELLRKKLNFKGVVMTDDLQMNAIAKNYSLPEAVRLAVNAGADILIFGNNNSNGTYQSPQEIVDMIYTEVKAGKISESLINDSYKRIMDLKSLLKE